MRKFDSGIAPVTSVMPTSRRVAVCSKMRCNGLSCYVFNSASQCEYVFITIDFITIDSICYARFFAILDRLKTLSLQIISDKPSRC